MLEQSLKPLNNCVDKRVRVKIVLMLVTHKQAGNLRHATEEKRKGRKQGMRPGHPYQKKEGSLPPGRGKNQDLQGPKTRYKIMNENIVGTEKKTAQHISHNAKKQRKS